MQKFFFSTIVFCALLFAACKKNIDTPAPKSRVISKTSTFATGSLDSTQYIGKDGKRHFYYSSILYGYNTIFRHYILSEMPDSANSARSTMVCFQADSGVTSFSYTDDEMVNRKFYYLRQDQVSGGQYWSSISKGTIRGHKQANGSWLVNIDIILPTQYDYVINATEMHDTATFVYGKP